MDQVKIGSFMKELRKEKNLTQQQIAEQFLVSNRTVSRWENGNNMPDLQILIEMADFYDVELKELLRGERKSEKMDKELKETVSMVADYSKEEKSRLLKRMHIVFLIGMFGFTVAIIIEALGLENTAPYDAVFGFGSGLAFGIVFVGVIFTSKYAAKIRDWKLCLLQKRKDNRKGDA